MTEPPPDPAASPADPPPAAPPADPPQMLVPMLWTLAGACCILTSFTCGHAALEGRLAMYGFAAAALAAGAAASVASRPRGSGRDRLAVVTTFVVACVLSAAGGRVYMANLERHYMIEKAHALGELVERLAATGGGYPASPDAGLEAAWRLQVDGPGFARPNWLIGSRDPGPLLVQLPTLRGRWPDAAGARAAPDPYVLVRQPSRRGRMFYARVVPGPTGGAWLGVSLERAEPRPVRGFVVGFYDERGRPCLALAGPSASPDAR